MASALTWLAPAHADRALYLIGRLQNSCISEDCHIAVGFLNRSLDSRVSPCDDIYGFACGLWGRTDDAGAHLSYRERLYEDYVRLAHDALIAKASVKASARPEVHQLIHIYGSCLRFFTDRTTDLRRLWEAAGVDAKEWLTTTNFSHLFRLVVDSTLQNSLPSVLHVIPAINSQVAIVLTGRSLSMHALVPDLVDQLLSEASVALGMNLSKEGLSADVLELEEPINNITSSWRRQDAVLSLPVETLDVPSLGVAWGPLLNSTGELKEVRCNNAAAVRSILTTLASARRLKAAALYTLLVPFSAFLGLEYCVAELRPHLDAGIMRKMCLGNTEFLFPRTFHLALSSNFEGNTSGANMTQMWTRIQLAGSKMLTIARGLKLNGHVLKAVSLSDIRATTQGGTSTEPLGASYGDDFVANLIVFTGATGRVVDVSEMLVYELRRTRFVPTAYLAPDFYYAKATEPSVNYATMGAFVAKMLFNRSLPEHRLPGHTTCFIRYAKEHLSLAVPEQHEYVDRLLRTSWAMEVARAASHGDNTTLADKEPLAQLFYLRFAEPYCGETETPRVAALRYAARTSASFAEAFGCPQPEPVGC
ncbi:hypothetical protein V5799_017236 [Amblyomma americanum]|uniref:Uncharacterized protein n=1 Tax=Amblyomma americanum TaxID=6943 RepID=A0AAQ4F3Q0_AMBAM